MKYNCIEAFVPSGKDFQSSRGLFLEIGFKIDWENDQMISFENNGCRFLLQNFAAEGFAENMMMRVTVDDLDEFWREISEKRLPENFGVKLTEPKDFPWGREVNLIDIAGVCWHFAQTL